VTVEVLPLVTMVGIALGLGAMTMYRETLHSPTVLVSKKARSSLQEIEDPASAHRLGRKFIATSPLRSVARGELPFGRN
jgi:2-iminoacetate synthase ThiH